MVDFFELNSGKVRWWVSSEFRPLVEKGSFADIDKVCSKAALLKDLPGKRTLQAHAGARTYLIKIYKKRSVWRRVAKIGRASPARRELECFRQAAERGVPTVPLLGAAQWKGRSAVVCEKLAGCITLQEKLGERRDAELLRRYGEFARRIHDAGIDQDDFNPTNILCRNDDLLLIDFERVDIVLHVPEGRRLRVLAKLLRQQSLGWERFEDFLSGYLRANESREETLERIRVCAQKQFKTDRARLRRNCVRENRNFARIRTPSHDGFLAKRYGLAAKQAAALVSQPEGYFYKEFENVLGNWKEANAATVDGGPHPVAVLREKGRRRGFLVYNVQALES